MRKNKKNKKGFSFLEVIITIGIFSLISVVTVSAFASVMKASQETREIQKNMESAGTAMESMAKIIRMSSNVVGTSTDMRMYNTSQGKCIRYNYAGGILTTNEFVLATTGDPAVDCQSDPNYTGSDVNLISGLDSLAFNIIQSDDDTAGKATILMVIGGKRLQTTVSFMDYE